MRQKFNQLQSSIQNKWSANAPNQNDVCYSFADIVKQFVTANKDKKKF